jgi:hypothetical protein
VDNLKAGLVWERTFYLESLLDAYLASHDESLLEKFTQHADDIFKLRDDMLSRKDYAGRIRPGWSVAHHYTYSFPVVLNDDAGQPSLSVRAVRWTGNQATRLSVKREGEMFSFVASNDFRVPKPLVEQFDKLTLQNIESVVNRPRGRDRLIIVQRQGERPPTAVQEIRFTPMPMVFHTHHTGVILAPILRFAALVKRGTLPGRFAEKTNSWAKLSEQSIKDYEGQWEDHGESGFYRIERSSPFWVDGAPEPINSMAGQGRTFLYLWQATDNPATLKRVKQIIALIKRWSRPLGTDAIQWPYWHSEAYRGWSAADKVSMNTPDFPPYSSIDNSHYAQYTIRFLGDAYKAGIDVSKHDIDLLTGIFGRVWKGDSPLGLPEGGFLATAMNGGENVGRDDVDVFGYLSIASKMNGIAEKVSRIYNAKFRDIAGNAVALYSWALLARVNRELQETNR